MNDSKKKTHLLQELRDGMVFADSRGFGGLAFTMHEAAAMLQEQPVIVRCQNCKHWDKGHAEDCHNIRSVCFGNGYCPPEWFCPVGERGDPD